MWCDARTAWRSPDRTPSRSGRSRPRPGEERSVSLTLTTKMTGVTPWFEGDIPLEAVPEKYRLARAFVPKTRYLDPDFLKLELEKLFTRTWLVACRVEELPGVGCYVEYEDRK